MKKGKVWLIGAGCGDADLITLRGLEALRSADAVVYDDLIARSLLNEAKGAEIFYMGKRSGRHSYPQEQITEKIAELANAGKDVARLKGGDPFVFGRGGEEAERLIAEGIPFEVVPGISSSIAIPAMAGIPVTQRKLSRGFMVITGHTAKGGPEIPGDIDTMASFSGTVVILMGLSRLGKIAEALIERGKDPGTPSAVISGGNSADPKTVRGKLSEIADLTEREGVTSPAVIVIGPTAALDFRQDASHEPLRGVRVGITGTPEFSKKLARAFRERGASPIEVLSSSVVPLPFGIGRIADGKPRWIVFTSANGVRTFFSRLKEEDIDMRRLHSLKFAVIGKPTGSLLASFGIHADLCPSSYTSGDLAEEMKKSVPLSEEIVLLRAGNATDTLPRLLREAGYRVEDVSIYRTVPDIRLSEAMHRVLPTLDYITFSSAGGVRTFMEQHGELPEGVRTVAIGKITAGELMKACGRCDVTAERADTESIAEAVEADLVR